MSELKRARTGTVTIKVGVVAYFGYGEQMFDKRLRRFEMRPLASRLLFLHSL